MPTKPSLTDRQAEILAFIREHMIANGCPPTVREINAHFGFASDHAGHAHLRAIEKKGYLTLGNGKTRAIRLAVAPGCCAACGRPFRKK